MITDDKPFDPKTEQQIIGLCQTHDVNLFTYLRVRLLYGVIPGDLHSCLSLAACETDYVEESHQPE